MLESKWTDVALGVLTFPAKLKYEPIVRTAEIDTQTSIGLIAKLPFDKRFSSGLFIDGNWSEGIGKIAWRNKFEKGLTSFQFDIRSCVPWSWSEKQLDIDVSALGKVHVKSLVDFVTSKIQVPKVMQVLGNSLLLGFGYQAFRDSQRLNKDGTYLNLTYYPSDWFSFQWVFFNGFNRLGEKEVSRFSLSFNLTRIIAKPYPEEVDKVRLLAFMPIWDSVLSDLDWHTTPWRVTRYTEQQIRDDVWQH